MHAPHILNEKVRSIHRKQDVHIYMGIVYASFFIPRQSVRSIHRKQGVHIYIGIVYASFFIPRQSVRSIHRKQGVHIYIGIVYASFFIPRQSVRSLNGKSFGTRREPRLFMFVFTQQDFSKNEFILVKKIKFIENNKYLIIKKNLYFFL